MKSQQATIADSFLDNCSLFPDNNAIYINDEYFTYTQVLTKVYSIYLELSNQEKTFERIGIYCTDDFNTYASVLAVTLYGAAYVPLNSTFPLSRNKEIIESAKLEIIVNCSSELFKTDFPKSIFINLENLSSTTDCSIEQLQRKVIQPFAYILFTSGSTGIPKGVPVSSENVFNCFDYFLDKKRFNFNEKDRFIQVFELTFDVSVFSFFLPLSVGACCYISPQKGIRFIEIVKMLFEHKITVANLVPSVLQHFEKYIHELEFPDLKYSFFCGEKLSHQTVTKWSEKIPNSEIINLYGLTETGIVCTSYNWNEKDCLKEKNNDNVPIGQPFPNVNFVLINELNEVIENDQIGELCFSGRQIINHYLNNTYENSFIQLQNSKGESQQFYKTGDLASQNSKGNLLFYGRIDKQVKINGHRIELNEIEEKIKTLTENNFHITCIEDDKKMNQLVLFIEKEIDEISFRKSLREILPAYMLPNSIILVDSIPLTINNKVDQKQLANLFYRNVGL